jgi:hypothetical protein
MRRLTCLAGVLWSVSAFAGAPGPEAWVAEQFGVSKSAIKSALPIALDDELLGFLVIYEKADRRLGALLPSVGPPQRLGRVDSMEIRGLVDLGASGPLPTASTAAHRLKRAGATRPTMVLRARYSTPDTATPSPKRRGRRSRPALRETTHLIELTTRLESLLRLETERQSSDGFGGHRIGGLTLVVSPDGVHLEGTRQDHQPARRSRCKKPPPVPIRFVLRDGRFHEVDHQPSQGCGRGGLLKLPKPADK